MSITSYILHCGSDGTSPQLRPATHGASICLAAYCPYLSGVSAGYSTVQYSTVQYSVSAGECAESCSASAQSAGIFIMIEKSYTSNFTLKSLSAQHSFY